MIQAIHAYAPISKQELTIAADQRGKVSLPFYRYRRHVSSTNAVLDEKPTRCAPSILCIFAANLGEMFLFSRNLAVLERG